MGGYRATCDNECVWAECMSQFLAKATRLLNSDGGKAEADNVGTNRSKVGYNI
jgi:hypothetical protein